MDTFLKFVSIYGWSQWWHWFISWWTTSLACHIISPYCPPMMHYNHITDCWKYGKMLLSFSVMMINNCLSYHISLLSSHCLANALQLSIIIMSQIFANRETGWYSLFEDHAERHFCPHTSIFLRRLYTLYMKLILILNTHT